MKDEKVTHKKTQPEKDEIKTNSKDTDEIKNEETAKKPEKAKKDDHAEKTSKEGQVQDEVNEADQYKAKAEEYLKLAQRVQADFDNFRRRTTQEREEWSKYGSLQLAQNILPVLDNFERALQAAGDDVKHFMDGIQMIYKQLKDALEKEGITPMEAVGKEFDPNLHQAVMQGPSDEYPDNIVIEEFQKGYLMADRVIRPAMVKVAQN